MSPNAQIVAMVTDAMDTATDLHETVVDGKTVKVRLLAIPKIEAILAFGVANYPPVVPEDQDDVSRAFNEKGWPTFDVETLDGLRQSIVPIVALRYMLATNHCTFDPAKTPSWRGFMDRYQTAILDA